MSGHYVVLLREKGKNWESAYGLFSTIEAADDYIENELKGNQNYNISISEATDEEIDKVLEIRMRSNRSMVGTELVGIRKLK